MKTYNSSDLSTGKRSKILDEAAENGVIIQQKKTNGVVMREFLLCDIEEVKRLQSRHDDLMSEMAEKDKRITELLLERLPPGTKGAVKSDLEL
jgi:hypothetical protein